jgi:hypothetical protein
MKMNLVDAMIEIKEGRCEGIKLLGTDLIILGKCSYLPLSFDEIVSDQWVTINPKPQYEEVEVVKYVTFTKDGRELITNTASQTESDQCIKLTGKRKVEIKPKVKERFEIKELYPQFQVLETPFLFRGKKVRLFAEEID